eukprot:5612211-Prymnesium_polylepis.1
MPPLIALSYVCIDGGLELCTGRLLLAFLDGSVVEEAQPLHHPRRPNVLLGLEDVILPPRIHVPTGGPHSLLRLLLLQPLPEASAFLDDVPVALDHERQPVEFGRLCLALNWVALRTAAALLGERVLPCSRRLVCCAHDRQDERRAPQPSEMRDRAVAMAYRARDGIAEGHIRTLDAAALANARERSAHGCSCAVTQELEAAHGPADTPPS